MAFESNNFYVAKKHFIPKSNFKVDCKINTDTEIVKIFSISAEASVLTKEVILGEINYTGNIESCIVYLSENGEILTTHSTCPFTSKITADFIKPDQKVVLNIKVCDYVINETTSNSLDIIYSLEQAGIIIENQEIKNITSNDEDISLKQEEISIIKMINEGQSSVCVDVPFVSRDKIKKLLLTECQASIKDVETGINYVSVTGEVITRLLYLTDDDKFESAYVFETFKEEVEVSDVTKESQADAFAFVNYSEIKATLEEAEKGSKAIISIPINLFVIAYEEKNINVVSDLYSTVSEIQIETQSFDMSKHLPIEIIEGKIDGSLMIDDEQPRIDKILFYGGNSVSITNVINDKTDIQIEGLAKTNVVYLNDETGEINSVDIEIPFVLNDKIDLEDNYDLSAMAVISDVDVSVKKGREIFYEAKIKALLYVNQNVISAVLSDAKSTDVFEEKDYAMEIVFAKQGQTSWEIAKNKKIKEEQLFKQNPEVIFPLIEDSELVLFYQKTTRSDSIL